MRIALLCAVLIFAAVTGRAQSPAALPPTPHVIILPIPGLTLIDTSTFRYDAGIVDSVRTPRFQQAFTLENDTKQTLTVAKLRGSCGCETLLLQKGGTQVSSTSLKPGERADFHLAVQIPSGQSGPVRKYVWVDGPKAGGQDSPLAMLEVDMNIRQAVSFTPNYLEFGKVESGAGASRTLTVLADADLVAGMSLPRLESFNPDIHIQALGVAQYVQEADKKRIKQVYQVMLSPSAHAGHITGSLHFTQLRASGGQALLANVRVSVAGTVSGALDAMPASLFFGSLPAGKPVTRSIILSIPSPTTARSLSASADSPWLEAALSPFDLTAKHRLLTVTLTARAPVGPIQSKVTITSAEGDHLEIPVIAELTK